MYTSLERPTIWFSGAPTTGSRRRPRLELLNMCSSCKKQAQMCIKRTITSKKQAFY